MTLLFDDVSARTELPQPSIFARLVRAAGRWFAHTREERARRLAMLALLEMEPHRLRDIGITPGDVADALIQSRR